MIENAAVVEYEDDKSLEKQDSTISQGFFPTTFVF